jgi:hypothetical protein
MLSCKICNNKLNSNNLIELINAPNSAQNFLKKNKKNKKINLVIKECANCGVIQNINKPVSYYKNVIRAAGFSETMKRFRFNQFNMIKKKYNLKNKKIIEIGSGPGDYLSILSKIFKNSYGTENSALNYKIIKKKKLKIFNCYLDKSNKRIAKFKFDAFFIFSYLEHVPKFNVFLKAINNNLNDNSVGFIEVPNFEMILKKKLYSEFISDHIFYFTKATLKRSLEINGFDVVSIKSIWNNYILHAIVKKRSKTILKDKKKNFINMKKKIIKFLSKTDKENSAVWGAGHQSLTILSQINHDKLFKYIVDSARFKQNKYAPGLKLKIVSPKSMYNDNIKAIVILAGAFSNEIYKNIKKNKKNIKILYQKDGYNLSS